MTEQSVLNALREQLDCYRDLLKLAQVQHEHVRDSRTEELLLVLAQRQQVLDQIGRLEAVIGPARKRWPEYLNELAIEDRKDAETQMSAARALLEEITASDRNDALVLQQRKINLGRDINQATAARQFNRAYSRAAYGAQPTGLDLQR